MAILNYTSAQKQASRQPSPIEKSGKLRYAFFNITTAATGDDGSTFDLCDLPPGRVRVLPHSIRVVFSAMGASRVLKVGHGAYVKSDDIAKEPENLSAFGSGIDVSSASATANGTTLVGVKYDIFSMKGVVVRAQITGGTVPTGATLSGSLAYIVE